MKEEEEAVKRIKGEALKEKDDPGAFIFPIRLEGHVNKNALADTGSDINIMPCRIYEQLGREEMKKVDTGITMINHTQAEAMGILTNVLCQLGVTTLIATFLILDIPIDHDAPIVTMGTYDDEAGSSRSKRSRQHETVEENRMGCDGEGDDMLRIRLHEAGSNEDIFIYVAWIRAFNINEPIYADLCHEFYSTYEFDEVYADDELQPKKIIKFILGGHAHSLTLLEFARRLGLYQAVELDDEGFNVYFKGSLPSDEHFNAQEYWLSISQEENLGLSRSHTSTIRSPILMVIHKMITYGYQRTTGTHDDEVGSSRSKRSRQHEIVEEDVLNRMGCDGEIDDMLRIKLREAKSNEEIFTFVAWIRAFNINEPIYVEFCHEFYSTYEFDKVYADDELQTKKIIKFRLIGRAHNLTLLEVARRLGLYYADELEEDGFNVYFEGGLSSDEHFNAQEYWLSISQEENLGLSRSHTSTIWSLIFRTPEWIARKCTVLTEDVVRSLSAPIYYRDLDSTPLRDLIDSEGKLILEDPQPGVPRVGIPRPPRASMQDLYDRMEIHQEAIERMEYRQDPPGYAQPQYDQYYQQYPPPPQYSPQYQQQQQDDDE
ncbi:uncharacterized mitochondrial protein-like protein [Tanacetum coccineum]